MFYVGIDDTDSIKGMCTTYIGALLSDELSKYATVEPKLVRLNPNIKWKTRGNASICLKMNKKPRGVEDLVLETIEKYAEFDDTKTHPGAVFYEGEIPEEFREFYRRCLHKVVKISEAEDLAVSYNGEVHRFKKGRGIIGALAAIGSTFEDRTFEVIAYREKKNWGKERLVDRDSVYRMDANTFPWTFNNVDEDRILITPRAPCPILFGIRGESPEILKNAYEQIKTGEKIERTIIFETNQGTDAHLVEVERIKDIRSYSSVVLSGVVDRAPQNFKGGHVIFSISNGHGSIDCAAYEPTRYFRDVIKKLIPGDIVRVYGGIRSDGRKTINLEKIYVLKLTNLILEENPLCSCGRRMESVGKGQGFRCRHCKTVSDKKVKRKLERGLEEKLYQVPPGVMRHLTKPVVRFSIT